MKKVVFIILTTIFICSCHNDPKKKLVGEWKEYYGIGKETDVNDIEIYKIQLTTQGDLIITCLSNNSYLFDRIIFDGNELSYRQENISDPNEKFYIYGKLKLKNNEKWLEGTMENSRNQNDNIKWEKLK